MIVTNSTFVGNSAGAGGAIDTYDGSATLIDNIFANNTATNGAGWGGAIYDNSGVTTFTENNNLFYKNSGGNFYKHGSGAVTLSSTDVQEPNTGPSPVASLGSYGGLTQTDLPVPGSPAICAGTTALPGTLLLPGTDQRGFARLNTMYTGFSATSPCIDIGSVQTDYTAIQFTNGSSGYTETAGSAVDAPAPIVSVTENGQTNLDGVPLTLTLSPTPSPAATGVTANTASGSATFSGLTVSTAGTYTLSSSIDYTPNGTSTPVSLVTTPTTPTLVVSSAAAVGTTTTLSPSTNSVPYGSTGTLFTATVTPDSGSHGQRDLHGKRQRRVHRHVPDSGSGALWLGQRLLRHFLRQHTRRSLLHRNGQLRLV